MDSSPGESIVLLAATAAATRALTASGRCSAAGRQKPKYQAPSIWHTARKPQKSHISSDLLSVIVRRPADAAHSRHRIHVSWIRVQLTDRRTCMSYRSYALTAVAVAALWTTVAA